MTIHHLVLSGGGPAGFSIYGALRESAKSGMWTPTNIQSIWSTSAGAMVGAMIVITTDWDILDNYIIRCPWDKVCNINLYTLMNAYMGCGLLQISVIEKLYSPLLLSNDYDVNITLQDFYEKTGIDFHVFSAEINQGVCVDISHETHPTWRLVDAVYASCSLPGMFSPLIREEGNCAYIDGGFYCNYPLKPCIDKHPDLDTILGIVKHINTDNNVINHQSTLLDFIGKITALLFDMSVEKQKQTYVKIPHEIKLNNIVVMNVDNMKRMLSDETVRREFIEFGVNACRERAL